MSKNDYMRIREILEDCYDTGTRFGENNRAQRALTLNGKMRELEDFLSVVYDDAGDIESVCGVDL